MTRITPKNIKRLRERASLSQLGLALKLGWSSKKASMISCWERGVCQPSLIERRQLRELMRSIRPVPTSPKGRAIVKHALRMVKESRARMNKRWVTPRTEMVWHPPLEQQCEALMEALSDIVELADQIKDPEVFRRHAKKIAERSRFLSMQCKLTISDAAARKLVRGPSPRRV